MHAGGPLSGRYTRIERQLGTDRKDGRSSSPAGRLPACAQHKYPAQMEDIEKAYRWFFEQGIRPQKHRQHRSLHWRKPCCEPSGYPSCEGCCSGGAILSVSPWYDLEATNQTMDNNAETDELFTKALQDCFRISCSHFTSLTVQLDETQLLQAEWRSYSVSATS